MKKNKDFFLKKGAEEEPLLLRKGDELTLCFQYTGIIIQTPGAIIKDFGD